MINFSLSRYQNASAGQQADIASIVHKGFMAGEALHITDFEHDGIDQVQQAFDDR